MTKSRFTVLRVVLFVHARVHRKIPAVPVAEWVRSLYFSALNHSIISPLCLV